MAQKLSEFLGQSVVIENKPGATGMIGAASVAKSAPDGYTVLFGAASEMAINASLFKNMTYDPRGDFEPVTLVANLSAGVRCAGDHEPVAEGTDRGCARQARFGQVDRQRQPAASGRRAPVEHGQGQVSAHKGSGPLVQDAVGGHVDMAVSSVPPAVPLVRSGKLRTTAEQFRQFVHDEVAKSDRIVSQAGIQPE